MIELEEVNPMNLGRQEYVNLLKDAALTAGKSLVMGHLVKKWIWMSAPVANPLIAMIVGAILTIAIKETEFGLFFFYIDLRTTAEGQAFQEAALHNFKTQQEGTPEEKKNAEMDLINSFRLFAKFNS